MSLSTVTTPLGTYKGVNKESYSIFWGVPFAEAPVGDLRWRAPVAKKAFEGEFDATKFGKCCPQKGSERNSFYYKEFHSDPTFETELGEDCLNLSIWTPATKGDEKLPVAVFIHGGAFDHGYNSEMEFDGEAYAKRGVILVSINYRLGAFGFFSHPLLSEESGYNASGNYGLMDQICALEFVNKYISYFGGDPNNITVFGQSAGSMSINYLLSSPLTKGLFHKAIMQSGGGYKTPFSGNHPSFDSWYPKADDIFNRLNVKTLDEARNISWEALFDAQVQYQNDNPGQMPFMPVLDNHVLVESSDSAIDNHRYHLMPVMIGSCGDEFGSPQAAMALKMAAANFAKAMHEQSNDNVYCYYFDRKMPGDELGAFHSADLWYMFGTLNRCWRPFTEDDHKLSETMLDYWTSFMKDGRPTAKNETWEPYHVNEEYMTFTEKESKMSK